MKKTSESGYVQHVRKKTEAREAWAEKAMGDILYFGIGMEEEKKRKKVEEDHKNAFEWYRKAAKQGDPSAMHAVGRSYYFGEGIKENDKKAAEWYHKAMDAGDVNSLYALARMYERGIGVNQNLSKAENLYLKLITEHSHTSSFYPLAQLYLNNLENREINANPKDIFRLLFLASNLDKNKAAEHDIDSLSRLWGDLSPVQRKQIWEVACNDLQEDWFPKTQDEILGINEKIAVTEPPSKSLSDEDVYNRIWRSVVCIETDEASGSGVFVQPDIVATNYHVVKGANKIDVYPPKERSGEKSIPYPVNQRPVRASGGEDYCLLHVPSLLGSGIPATIRRYDTLRIGETVYALGAPHGAVLSLSKGIISQLRRDTPDGHLIQSDVDIESGSSGGGLFDSAGNLIGHPTFDVKRLAFSITADIVLGFGEKPAAE